MSNLNKLLSPFSIPTTNHQNEQFQLTGNIQFGLTGQYVLLHVEVELNPGIELALIQLLPMVVLAVQAQLLKLELVQKTNVQV